MSSENGHGLAEPSRRPADVLSSVLGTLRLCRPLYCASELSAPWAIRFGERKNPIFHVVDRGAAWLSTKGEVPLALVGGDVVLFPHGDGHSLSDEPGRTPKLVDFADHPQVREGGGPACWGGGGAKTLLVCGEFHVEGPTLFSLLAELPRRIVLRAGEGSEWLTMALRLLSHEVVGHEPGAELLMERLVEVIFIQCVRGWLRTTNTQAASTATAKSWLWALREPDIARALSLLHQSPAYAWSVEELGRRVGLSRSVFAERFTQAVGEPPLSYLTRWRMQLSAARLLSSPNESPKSIADAVGYQSVAAWNRAFHRYAGTPPGAFRESVARRAVTAEAAPLPAAGTRAESRRSSA